jgi:alanyl-tRNA synthetase
MISQTIRRRFLQFFKEKGHTVVPSSAVVPHDDPSILFTNAGMNQFKDVFLGKSLRDYTRATSSQKCVRVGGKHNDLDNVGHTARHLTFFEMLGNFSFGDYFKKEAIAFAWEATLSVFEFDPKKVWITIFREDDEAFELWKQHVPEERIVRMDEKDNFWMMGDTGPCGPCSELYFDRGSSYGSARSPKEDVDGVRYIEFWNLVFMQFNRDSSGKMHPLPKPSIDTGAGLERVIALKLDVETVFQTDIFKALIEQIEEICGRKYDPKDALLAPAYHVISDHLRSLSFAIADGAQPSNVERGYILRKLLRRAVRYGRVLGLHEPFLARILPRLVALMGPDYPELIDSQNLIAEILTLEEEAFLRTLKRGGHLLSGVIEKSQKSALKQISGEDAFKLKDTYGFPLEEILLIAKDYGLQVNLESYELLQEQAKERSKSAREVHSQQVEESTFKSYVQKQGISEFVGYTALETEATVNALFIGDAFQDTLQEGDEGIILLNKSPFYAEKGGQVGDTGYLTHKGSQFRVSHCNSPFPGVIAHQGRVEKGEIRLGEQVLAQVDPTRRQEIANNHTATHLLHYALYQVLGTHIKQAGSLVEDKRLRFDFNHHKALSPEEIRAVETLVNDKIREATPVHIYELSYEDVQKHPQIKQFFGDKYGSTVRVVDIAYSKELCGGTHTSHVGTIGLFKILRESSIASGVRRIEAVTGKEAEKHIYEKEELIEKAAGLLKVAPSKLMEKLEAFIEENKTLSSALKACRLASLKTLKEELLSKALEIKGLLFVGAIVPLEAELLLELTELLHAEGKPLISVLGAVSGERCQLIVRLGKGALDKGLEALKLIREIAPCIEGGGGGKADRAQAGGKRPEGLGQALEQAREWVTKQI